MNDGGGAYLAKLRAELEGSPYRRHMGIRFVEVSEDGARLEMPVSSALVNPNGGLHGGAAAEVTGSTDGRIVPVQAKATDDEGRTVAVGLGAYAVSRETTIGTGEEPD